MVPIAEFFKSVNMKTSLITTLLLLLSVSILYAQHKDLNKLPQKERDSILVKIANKSIERYSTGYLRPGNKPYIEDIGYKPCEVRTSFPEYNNRYIYAVYYPPTEEEKEYFKENYLVKAYILADIGKVTLIRYIDDYDWVRCCIEKEDPNREITSKRRFKTVEELKKEREKYKPKTIYIDPLDSTLDLTTFSEEDRNMILKARERHAQWQRKRDTMRMLRQRYLQRQDSIRRADSIRNVNKKQMP